MIHFKPNINFTKNSTYIFIVSMIIMLASIALISFKGINLGIDFTSGTRFDMAINNSGHPIKIESLKSEIIDKTKLKDNFVLKELKGEGTSDTQIFSLISQENFDIELIESAIDSKKYPINKKQSQLLRISPKMGKELADNATWALSVAMIAILIYITFRFNRFFALSSIIALIHDVTITVGIFSLFNLPINLPIVAAFLTILGYSLNDTIVVFDRIRENLNISKKEDNISLIVNQSINQTLSRTILTSLTTLIVLTILYLVGSYLIKLFTLALIFGVIIGTYSSIFVASFSFTILYNKYGHLLKKSDLDELEE